MFPAEKGYMPCARRGLWPSVNLCAGVSVESLCLSRPFRQVHAQPDAGKLMYDALFCMVSDRSGQGHDRPEGRTA